MRKNAKVNQALLEIAANMPLVTVQTLVLSMRHRDLSDSEQLLLGYLNSRVELEHQNWLEINSWRELSKKRRAESLLRALSDQSGIDNTLVRVQTA
jgi:hypothetical protein